MLQGQVGAQQECCRVKRVTYIVVEEYYQMNGVCSANVCMKSPWGPGMTIAHIALAF